MATSHTPGYKKTPRKAALVLNHLFFPADTAPGVAIIGLLGDRYGRKFALGCLPTFEQAGYLVPHHPGDCPLQDIMHCSPWVLSVRGLAMSAYLGAIHSGNWVGIFAAGTLMSGLLYACSNAVWPAFCTEMFPTAVRGAGLALGPQIGFCPGDRLLDRRWCRWQLGRCGNLRGSGVCTCRRGCIDSQGNHSTQPG